MPSKELIALAANAMEERRKELIAQPLSRIYPQLAEAAAGAIHAALREPNANQEQAGMECIINRTRHSCPEIYVVPETPWHTWRAMPATSALCQCTGCHK